MKVNGKKVRISNKEQKELKELGLSGVSFTRHEKISDLIKTIPSMVLAKVVKPGRVLMAGKYEMRTKINEIYCMNYGLYKQMSQDQEYMIPHKKRFASFFKRYRGQNLDGKKILIWRTGGLGDLLFCQPSIKYLREKFPTAQIDFATGVNNVEFFESWEPGLIDNVLQLPFYLKTLNSYNYHATFEGSIERCHESETLNAYDIFKKVLRIEYDVEDYKPLLIPKPDLVEKFKDVIKDETILIHIKSTSPVRNMSIPKWGDIVQRLIDMNYKIVLVDSPDGYNHYEEFIDRFNFNRRDVLNLSKQSKTINDAVAIASLCKGMIGIDSSMTHICGSMDIPVVGLYGPFLSDLRLRYYKYAEGVDATGYIECGKYPCFAHNDEMWNCPSIKTNMIPGCLQSLREDDIIEKFKKVMKKRYGVTYRTG